MKFVITAKGNSLKSKFDVRFGRSEWFCIWDTEKQSAEFMENRYKDANGGAGTKAAEWVAEINASKVISGDYGPKAKSMLSLLGIQMITLDYRDKTIQEILKLMYQ